jgi:hypothetical protein
MELCSTGLQNSAFRCLNWIAPSSTRRIKDTGKQSERTSRCLEGVNRLICNLKTLWTRLATQVSGYSGYSVRSFRR